MSISFVRAAAPGEEDCSDRNDPEIVPTLPVVLGRGSLLKCGDKRVSRRHAYLDWDDDAVMITSVHQNPTFVVVKGVEKALTEGDSCLLCHGDKFGLLKTNFWYKINLPTTCLEEQNSPAADIIESKKSIENTTKQETSRATPLKNSSDKNGEAKETSAASVPTNHVKDNEEKELVPALKENSTSSVGRKIPTKDPTPDVSKTSLSGDNDVNMHAEEQKENDPLQGNSVCKPIKADPAKTLSVEELQKAVLSRKRELPAWLKNIDPADNKAAQNRETQNCHGGSRKSQPSATKRKLSKGINADSDVEDSVVKQTNTERKGKKQGLHDKGETPKNKKNESPKNKRKSPSPRKNASPCKPKGSTINNRTKGLHVVSDDSEENSDSETNQTPASTPKKNNTPKKKTSPKVRSPVKHDVSDDDAESSESENENSTSASTPKKNKMPKKKTSPKVRSPVKHDVSDDDAESSESEDENSAPATRNAVSPTRKATRKTPSPKKQPRQNCQYGAGCYRKNSKHRADFAHPGDPDYQDNASDSEDADDDRPECEFGIDCYRKNKRHRKDFRHSRIPQPQRRAKRKARQQKQRDAGSDSDEYDYEDPFLNDDSSDDYAPTDSGDDSPMEAEGEEEEDTKRMLKEGKKFVRKR